MIQFISVVGLLKYELCFAILSLIGYVSAGIFNTPFFMLVMAALGVLNIVIVVIAMFKEKTYSLKAFLLLLAIPVVISVSYLMALLNYGFDYSTATYFFWFLAYSLPAIFIGFYCGQRYLDDSFNLTLFIELTMLVITASSVVSVVVPMMHEVGFTTESYQSASYTGALAFGMNLYYLFWGKNHRRPKAMNSIFYKIFQILMLPIQLLSVVITGGGIGLLLISAYLIVVFFTALFSRNWKILMAYGFLIGFGYLGMVIFYDTLMGIPIVETGWNRVARFFNPPVPFGQWCQQVWQLFSTSPITGHGLFSLYYMFPSKDCAHNLILKILGQGGIVFLALIGTVTIRLSVKYLQTVKHTKRLRELLFLCVFGVTLLMFDTSHVSNALLWFGIAYIVSIDHVVLHVQQLASITGTDCTLLGEIPLCKDLKHSEPWVDHIALRFDEFGEHAKHRKFAFIAHEIGSGVTTVMVNIANSLAKRQKQVLIITTEQPGGYDIKYRVDRKVVVLCVKEFDTTQIESSGVSTDRYDYLFFDCRPSQTPDELAARGIYCDALVYVVRTGIAKVFALGQRLASIKAEGGVSCAIVLNGTFGMYLKDSDGKDYKGIYRWGAYQRKYRLR